jgi:DNA-binding NarL/FixJ family response regulator
LATASRFLRETLPKLLDKKGDLNVCGVSPCISNIASILAATGADVLILDSATARPSICTLLPTIISKVPNINVVLIDMDDDPEIFLECVRAGALSYLLKDAAAADVLSAVLAAARGKAVRPSHLVEQLPPYQARIASGDDSELQWLLNLASMFQRPQRRTSKGANLRRSRPNIAQRSPHAT